MLVVSSLALVHDPVLGVFGLKSLCLRMRASQYLPTLPIQPVIVPLAVDVSAVFGLAFNFMEIACFANACFGSLVTMVECLCMCLQILVFISNLELLSSPGVA